MKNLYHSNATIDTHPISETSLHNCPSCRCKSTEPLAKLKHVISNPSLRHNHNMEQNLYLSSHLSEAPSTERINIKPYQSIIFNSPSKIVFKNSTGVSSKQTNISFSYTSPPKNKKHHSSESKFNTRKYKQTHFPQISQDQSIESIPTGKTANHRKQTSPYYQVFTKQKTPEKHRLLKMKKEKSKQKLQVTISKNSSSQNSLHNQQVNVQSPIYNYNDYSMDGPRNTPINALWINGSQKTQKQFTSQQMRRFVNKDNVPASIQYIKQQSDSSKSISHLNDPRSVIAAKKYPTVESLEVYEALRYNENISQRVKINKNDGQTSLRYIKESSKQSSELKYQSQDIQLARSISQQLQLNYDYFYPQDDTDKSLSIHVTL